MSSKQAEGIRARKIFRALNIELDNINTLDRKRTKQFTTKHQIETTDSRKGQHQTLAKRPKKHEISLPVTEESSLLSSVVEQSAIISLPVVKESPCISNISRSEHKVLESMPLLPIYFLQKSLSLSHLTQDIGAEFSLQRKCKSDLIYGHQNDGVNEHDVWVLISGNIDVNLAVNCEQYAIEQTNPLSIKSNEVANNVIVPRAQQSKCFTEKTKSLSLSDLTSDTIKFPTFIRRYKSVMTLTEDSTLSFSGIRSLEHQQPSDDDEEYIPTNNLDQSITDCESCIEEFYGDLNAGKMRRLKAKPSEWAKNKAKALRMKGEQYIGYQKPRGERATQNVLRSARHLGATCNSDFCKRSKLRGCSQFTEETRKIIHSRFWKNLNWDQRKIFVTGHVTRAPTNRKTVKNEPTSRRQGTLQYSLPLTSKGDQKVQVCREMFLSTLSLGSYTVQSWVKKSEFCMSAQKTNSSLPVEPNEATRKKRLALETFLDSIPKLPSHYARKDTSKLYLEPMYNSLADLFKVYKEFCVSNNEMPVCRYTFEKRFDEKNLSLLTLKKDMCDICSTWLAGNLNEADYQMHVIQKDRARKEKSDDKKRAAKQEFILLTMDLQSVKVCPYLKASALYFKTKLTCHNFTVYNLTNKHCTCYWFNETAADLTSSTFVSFLLDYLGRHCLPLKLPIVIFSDGCTYQNRNVNLANALLNFSKLHGVTVTQKFLIPGHTQMECDSVHSTIERKLKNREIHLPSDYSTITKEARAHAPYEVLTIDHEFVKNYSDPKTWVYKSIRPGRKAGDAQVTDIRAIKYTPDYKIQVKLDFDEDWIDLPQRQQIVNHDIIYHRLHPRPIPIASTKYSHLQQLKSVIPQDCHAFYDNLPSTN